MKLSHYNNVHGRQSYKNAFRGSIKIPLPLKISLANANIFLYNYVRQRIVTVRQAKPELIGILRGNCNIGISSGFFVSL